MDKHFTGITVGRILWELSEQDNFHLSRPTFYRLEERLGFKDLSTRTTAKVPWRMYTRDNADEVKHRIKKEYGLE